METQDTPHAPQPDQRTRSRSAADRLFDAAAAFAATVVLTISVSSTEGQSQPQEGRKALIERCKEKYPTTSDGLTINDYLGIERWGDEIYPRPASERKPLLQMLKTRLRKNQLHSYEVSQERSQRIEEHVNRFAAGMVERANAGDETYKFYAGGSGAFLDGHFLSGPDGLEPATDDYEGFGWLWRNVEDENGKIVKQEIVDNIYRHSDGTYYAHPHPWILGVYDKNAQSTFEAPPALGLVECASVPGNNATQGWRVSHYDFNHLGEPGYHTVQLEPWVYGNTTIADVQLADKRALHFIDNRYDPDTNQ